MNHDEIKARIEASQQDEEAPRLKEPKTIVFGDSFLRDRRAPGLFKRYKQRFGEKRAEQLMHEGPAPEHETVTPRNP